MRNEKSKTDILQMKSTLISACHHQNIELVSLLLAAGVNVDEKTQVTDVLI